MGLNDINKLKTITVVAKRKQPSLMFPVQQTAMENELLLNNKLNGTTYPLKKEIPISVNALDSYGTYIDSHNKEKKINLQSYRDSLAVNPNFGTRYEAIESIPNSRYYKENGKLKLIKK